MNANRSPEDRRLSFSQSELERWCSERRALEGAALLRAVAREPRLGPFALLSSFGVDAAVSLQLLAEGAPEIPVLFIDTGYHFAETLAYRDLLVARLGLELQVISPAREAAGATSELWRSDPARCCRLRKAAPLQRALRGYRSWATGRRAGQTRARAALETLELHEDGRLRVNPIAHWSEEKLQRYKQSRGLPPHPLYARGYRSIGCAPCTSRVQRGEEARAGRWRGDEREECGIHLVSITERAASEG